MVEAIGTVDTTGINRETRLFAGEPFILRAQGEIVARVVHQILGIGLIHHGKIRIEPNGFPVGAQQPIGHGVKGAAPDGSERAASGLTQCSPGPAQHLVRSPARERKKHDPARIDPL